MSKSKRKKSSSKHRMFCSSWRSLVQISMIKLKFHRKTRQFKFKIRDHQMLSHHLLKRKLRLKVAVSWEGKSISLSSSCLKSTYLSSRISKSSLLMSSCQSRATSSLKSKLILLITFTHLSSFRNVRRWLKCKRSWTLSLVSNPWKAPRFLNLIPKI